MNRRQLKKAMKKKVAEALINQNEYLKREMTKLRRELSWLEKGYEQVVRCFEADVGAIARLYGEKVDGMYILSVPQNEVNLTMLEYEVDCEIAGGEYIVRARPLSDSADT